jgi:hypothetical protein
VQTVSVGEQQSVGRTGDSQQQGGGLCRFAVYRRRVVNVTGDAAAVAEKEDMEGEASG